MTRTAAAEPGANLVLAAQGAERTDRDAHAGNAVRTEHQPGNPQETYPKPTRYHHFLSDRISGHALKDGTIGWVDLLTRFPYFEVDFSALGRYRLAI